MGINETKCLKEFAVQCLALCVPVPDGCKLVDFQSRYDKFFAIVEISAFMANAMHNKLNYDNTGRILYVYQIKDYQIKNGVSLPLYLSGGNIASLKDLLIDFRLERSISKAGIDGEQQKTFYSELQNLVSESLDSKIELVYKEYEEKRRKDEELKEASLCDTLWEAILQQVQPATTRTLLRHHGTLLRFENTENAQAYISFNSSNALIKLVEKNIDGVESAFAKICQHPVKVHFTIGGNYHGKTSQNKPSKTSEEIQLASTN